MARTIDPFGRQRAARTAWRRYIDGLAEHRPALHTYCRRLAGNVWDAEDLVQDTLMRVFSLLGKTDANLENPRSYLLRTATNLWIDNVRRLARERAALALEGLDESPTPFRADEARDAAEKLLQDLHPQERAATVLKEVFDYSLEEIAAMLRTSVGAVKSALHRARGRLEQRKAPAGFATPPRALVDAFMEALSEKDMEKMRAICEANISGELVGGVELTSFDQVRTFFGHAHRVLPALGFGAKPWWKVIEYEGEPMVAGFRTLDGVEGLNEIHRIEAEDGKIVRVRTYCFCPETLAVVAQTIGVKALPRPHRSPSLADFVPALLGAKPAWRRVTA